MPMWTLAIYRHAGQPLFFEQTGRNIQVSELMFQRSCSTSGPGLGQVMQAALRDPQAHILCLGELQVRHGWHHAQHWRARWPDTGTSPLHDRLHVPRGQPASMGRGHGQCAAGPPDKCSHSMRWKRHQSPAGLVRVIRVPTLVIWVPLNTLRSTIDLDARSQHYSASEALQWLNSLPCRGPLGISLCSLLGCGSFCSAPKKGPS